ncbi:vacuolar calcium ion transporter /H(+) exchanger [Alternaria alternata]|nr:vacuolar calcium ion transporter /H(+) exchanger [Alternaria alternata]
MAHRSRSSRDYPSGHGHRSSRERQYTTEKTTRRGDDDRRDRSRRRSELPQYNHNGHRVTPGLHPEGESGRRGFNPIKFLVISGRSSSTPSMLVNCLWPIVPIAIAFHFAKPEWHMAIFITNYIAMLPSANLLGFAGQEFSRKMPNKAFAVVLETTFGSIVEIILFMVLIGTSNGDSNVQVIKAAILGSILANLLLCLGTCFIFGGLKNDHQEFHPAVSENGSGLMLVAASTSSSCILFDRKTNLSSGTAIISIIGYLIYVYFQTVSHDGLLHEIYEADDHKDKDRHEELAKPKLTMTEVIVALLVSLTCVALVAISLVLEIPYIVEERGVSDAFVGLILIPLVEKIAEHLLAIDEAYDNQINMALAHVLGASIQTALFNAPLVVLVGWGIGVGMDYNFAIFDAVALILAVLAVGSFLRDRSSNYLEGMLCVMTYIIIAICAFYFPNPAHHGGAAEGGSEGGAEGGH